MRIAYVLKRYPRYSETFILSELLAHQAAGLDIHVAALSRPSDGLVPTLAERVRYPIHYLDADRPRGRSAGSGKPNPERLRGDAAELARLIRREGIDHLHAHFATGATAVASATARLTGVPFSFTAHAKDIYHQGVDSRTLVRRLKAAARVVTVSDYNRDYLRGLAHMPLGHVVRIYNGLDLLDFPFVREGREDATILAVGRLIEKKGFVDLVDACGELMATRADVVCDIVGTGPLESALASRIAGLGLTGRIRLLGARQRDVVAARMRHATVLAAPCTVSSDGDRDGLPTVLLEAMASGLPCVTTPVTGIPEAVRDGRSGIIVPERSPRDLAAALGAVVANGRLADRLARQARAVAERDFDIASNAAQLRNVFRGAVSATAPLEGVA